MRRLLSSCTKIFSSTTTISAQDVGIDMNSVSAGDPIVFFNVEQVVVGIGAAEEPLTERN